MKVGLWKIAHARSGDKADRADIGDTLKRKLLGENALRMYGLQAPVAAR